MTIAAPAPSRRPVNWPLIGAWLALTLLLLAIALLVLRGCGIAWPNGQPIVTFCTVPTAELAPASLIDEQRQTASLLQRRAMLQQQLIALPPCSATAPAR